MLFKFLTLFFILGFININEANSCNQNECKFANNCIALQSNMLKSISGDCACKNRQNQCFWNELCIDIPKNGLIDFMTGRCSCQPGKRIYQTNDTYKCQ